MHDGSTTDSAGEESTDAGATDGGSASRRAGYVTAATVRSAASRRSVRDDMTAPTPTIAAEIISAVGSVPTAREWPKRQSPNGTSTARRQRRKHQQPQQRVEISVGVAPAQGRASMFATDCYSGTSGRSLPSRPEGNDDDSTEDSPTHATIHLMRNPGAAGDGGDRVGGVPRARPSSGKDGHRAIAVAPFNKHHLAPSNASASAFAPRRASGTVGIANNSAASSTTCEIGFQSTVGGGRQGTDDRWTGGYPPTTLEITGVIVGVLAKQQQKQQLQHNKPSKGFRQRLRQGGDMGDGVGNSHSGSSATGRGTRADSSAACAGKVPTLSQPTWDNSSRSDHPQPPPPLKRDSSYSSHMATASSSVLTAGVSPSDPGPSATAGSCAVVIPPSPIGVSGMGIFRNGRTTLQQGPIPLAPGVCAGADTTASAAGAGVNGRRLRRDDKMTNDAANDAGVGAGGIDWGWEGGGNRGTRNTILGGVDALRHSTGGTVVGSAAAGAGSAARGTSGPGSSRPGVSATLAATTSAVIGGTVAVEVPLTAAQRELSIRASHHQGGSDRALQGGVAENATEKEFGTGTVTSCSIGRDVGSSPGTVEATKATSTTRTSGPGCGGRSSGSLRGGGGGGGIAGKDSVSHTTVVAGSSLANLKVRMNVIATTGDRQSGSATSWENAGLTMFASGVEDTRGSGGCRSAKKTVPF